jgi:hypothetical protein
MGDGSKRGGKSGEALVGSRYDWGIDEVVEGKEGRAPVAWVGEYASVRVKRSHKGRCVYT